MGNAFSSNQDNNHFSEEDSSEDEDFLPWRATDSQEDLMEPSRSSNYATDAVESQLPYATTSTWGPCDARAITIDKVAEFDEKLDFFEKVALVYLLYETAEIALQHLMQLQEGAHLNVLEEWAKSCKKSHTWQVKLLEALCLIQNYEIISELGYSRAEVDVRFLPLNKSTSVFVNVNKKKLYRIFEDFTNAQAVQFLAHVRRDFQQKQLAFTEFPVQYLEMYMLHWTTIKYISPTDFTNLSRMFKLMGELDVSDSLKSGTPTAAHNTLVNNALDIRDTVETSNSPSCSNSNNFEVASFPDRSLSSVSSGSSIQQDRIRRNSYEDKSYVVNTEHPGVCLIINQKHFYREPELTLKHLLPKTDKPLEERKGTDVDCKSLMDTFGKFGFTVVVKNNLIHSDMIEAIKETVAMVTAHSSLIICILSHGVQGEVYGVNSIPVGVKDIRDLMCTTNVKNLKRKPKVLILQSCQGTQCQQVTENDDDEEEDNDTMAVDGPVDAVPRTADLLIFWATVPGYSAVRDKEKGTWFIQSLCKTIDQKAYNMHFEEICTLVKQEVIDKRWETKAMVPYQQSTLSRFFFFPPRLQNAN